jgi:alpha-glucosidase
MDAFQFIKDVAADWERSIALAGEVGDFVAFARQRRGGEDWFLGALTDEEPRRLELPLSFLGEDDGEWIAEIYRDGANAHWRENPYDIVIERRTVRAEQTLRLDLGAGGGAAVRFVPARGARP